MPLPVVAIVGRPNVGKSSLLNALARRRIAIVDSVPGVTRDRLSAVVPVGEGYVELLDTGGFGIEDRDDLSEHVNEQIEQAMASADLVLFVVDARQGVQPLDRAVAERLRRQAKPVILVANKVDAPNAAVEVGELYGLGVGEPVCTSAIHRLGLSELLEAVEARLGPPAQEVEEPTMKLAIVGKRNVGKSTFINALAREERMIVSERPGTTRDAVDVRFERDGQAFLAIDTAGVRRRSSVADSVEFYSQARTERSIRRCDVAVLMLDATVPVGRIEKHLARYIVEHHKPCVIVVNKWDLAAGSAVTSQYREYLDAKLPALWFAPLVFTTAVSGRHVASVVDVSQALHRQARTRVATGELNRVISQAVKERSPRPRRNRLPKILYATQVSVEPPTIILFVNDPALFDASYKRYLANRLRERLPFAEVPIRLLWRGRRGRDQHQAPG